MKIVAVEHLGINAEREEEIKAMLKLEGHDFVLFHDRVEEPDVLVQRIGDAEMVMVSNIPLPAGVLSCCPKLKFLNVAFTGLDHIDMDFCRERGIKVRNASGYATEAVAELAVALMLDVYRKVSELDGKIRKGCVRGAFLGFELKGKTVGIVGTGAIGLRTAEILKAFGCEVVGWSRTERSEFTDMGFSYVGLDELMASSDIISLHVPLTPETYHLIDAKLLSLCKKSAILVNTARGNVVDMDALAAALKAGNLHGAGIDVFEKEPPIPENHPLVSSPNCVLTPHVGYATREAFDSRIGIILDNISKF